VRGERTGRDGHDAREELEPERDRPAPGKVTSSQRLGNPGAPSYAVAPGKRTLTLSLPSGPAMPLPDADSWSQRMGADVSSTRVVTGPQAAESAEAIGARAFTVGKTIVFGDGAYQPSSPGGQHLLAHELAHTLQQPSLTPAGGALPASQPGDAHEREAHAAADLVMAGQTAPRMSPAPAMVAGDWFPFGKAGGVPVGPGGPIPVPDQTPRPKKNAGEYLTEFGARHASELPASMAAVTFALPSTYVTWRGGNSKAFAEAVGEQIRIRASSSGKVEDVLKNTLAPANLWEIVNRARDADNPDHPEQADQYHKEVTLELCNAYRDRVRDSLDRMIPRYINEWNRKTLEDYANRAKSGGSKGLTEHPESNRPGEAVRQAAPIDSVVLVALTGLVEARIVPDFAAYRKDFPAEAKVTARKEPKPLKSFTWQHDKGAANWIRVTDPADASIEDVAREMYGGDEMAYKITAAPPLFGLEPMGLKPDYYKALHAHGGGTSPELKPGGGPQTLPQQLLNGSLGDEAALAQAKGFKPGPSDPAAMRQQFDQIVQHFTLLQGEVGKIGEEDGQLVAARQRVEQRKQRITGTNPGEASAWSGQAREQLDILTHSIEGVQKAKQTSDLMKKEPAGQNESLILHAKIVRLYSRAASISDMVETARPMIEQAKRQTQTFVVDWLDEVFRYLRGAIINSRKNKRTGGAQDPGLQVPQLDAREEEIRLELQALRDELLNNPEAAKGKIEAIHKKLREMSVEVALIRNIDACDEAWATLKGGKSTMGWIRSLVPVGDHGNDRLQALQNQANKFEADWKKILDEYRTGDKKKAIEALEVGSKSAEWTSFFNSVAREIRDQAEYDHLMIFGAMVGIAILSGGIGAIAEAAVGAGTILGFVVGLTTEVTVFTALSYAITEKEHSVSGFWSEWKKNLAMFALMRMVSGAWKLAGGEKGLGEAVAQYAVINGHALYEANHKKVAEGKGALSLGEVLEISLENLTFLIGVSIGGALVQPWMSKLALRGAVGRRISEVEGLHKQVSDLAKKVEASKGKDQAAAKELLARQSELIDKQGALLDELARYADNPGAARDAGITEAQLKQIQEARGRLDSGRRQIAMVKLMGSLEPVSPGSFLIARDGAIVKARGEFEAQMKAETTEPPPAGEGIKTVGEMTTDSQTGAKSFTVEMKDGSSLKVTERITDQKLEQGSQRVSGAADPGAGGSCFVAGTEVATPHGPIAIEDILPGQTVLTWDLEAERLVSATVLRIMASAVGGTLELTVAGETIHTTSEHPFWVPGSGWLTASDLRPGTQLLSGSGARLSVDAMRRVDGATTVYNMEVGGLHTYLVSAARILVHNKSNIYTLVSRAQDCPRKARELIAFVETLPEAVPERARLLQEVKNLAQEAKELGDKGKEKDATPEKMEPLRQRIEALEEKLVKFEEQARDGKEKLEAFEKAKTDLKNAESQPGSGVDQPMTPTEAGAFNKAVADAGTGATPTQVLDQLAGQLPAEAREGLRKFRAEKGDDKAYSALRGMNQGGSKNLVRFLVEQGLTPEVRAQRLKAVADARTEVVRARLDQLGVLQGHKQVAVLTGKIVAELPPSATQEQVDAAIGRADVNELCGEIGEAIGRQQLAKEFKPEDGFQIVSNLEIVTDVPGYTSVSEYARAHPNLEPRELANLREGEGTGKLFKSEGEVDHLVVKRSDNGKLKPVMFEQDKSGMSDSKDKAAAQNTKVVEALVRLRGGQPDLHVHDKVDKTIVGRERTGDLDLRQVEGARQQTRGLKGKEFNKDLDVGLEGGTPAEQRSALEQVARLLVKQSVVNRLNTTTVTPPPSSGPPAPGGGG
jgi:hypothetical protein